MVTKELVNTLFEYKDGALYRKISTSNRIKVGDRAGSINSEGYRNVRVNNATHKEHRLIFLMHNGYLPEFVDHINGIRDDNRIENLRAATQSKNQYNTNLKSSNKSGIKGVSWSNRQGKWYAQLRINGIVKSLGYFNDIEEAKQIVQRARNVAHGEFANHG